MLNKSILVVIDTSAFPDKRVMRIRASFLPLTNSDIAKNSVTQDCHYVIGRKRDSFTTLALNLSSYVVQAQNCQVDLTHA